MEKPKREGERKNLNFNGMFSVRNYMKNTENVNIPANSLVYSPYTSTGKNNPEMKGRVKRM
jgi:hypothetical protein